MKKRLMAGILLLVMLMYVPATGYAAENQPLATETRKASEEEAEAVRNTYSGISTYSTSAQSVEYNIIINEYLTWGCAQRYGQDIDLFFTLINSARSDEQYYINIYDENKNFLAGTSGYFPSGNEGDINYLTVTWFWGNQTPGLYWIEFYSTSDQSNKGYYYDFYIAQPGVEQEINVSVPYTTLMVGETVQINATASGGYVEYSSYNEDVASVDSGWGTVTALAPGTAEIEIFAYPTDVYPWNYKTVTIRVGSKSVEDFVRRYYKYIMERDADQGGLDHWTNLLKTGQATAATVADFFLSSEEFIGQNNNNSVYLDRLYQSFFDREADASGKAYWMEELDAGVTRRWVTASFINSEEFSAVCEEYGIERGTLEFTAYADRNGNLAKYVTRCYRVIHERDADPSGLEFWCQMILTKERDATHVAKSFIDSPEFISRNLSDTEFMEVLYRTFMGRNSDPSGLAFWLGELQKGYSRLEIVERFADCPEFDEILASFGL